MNFAYWTEYTKLGLALRRNEGFYYGALKCSSKDVNFMGNPVDRDSTLISPWYSVRFCNMRKYCNLLGVANEDGTVRIHDSRLSNKVNPILNFQAHYNAIFDLVWLENEFKLVTCSGDHSAMLWDFGQGEAVPIVRMVGHSGSVKAASCKPGDPNVIATGARDGAIMQWDIRTNPCRSNVSDEEGCRSIRADKMIKYSHLRKINSGRLHLEKLAAHVRHVSSVVYQDAETIISSSTTDRLIKVWDTRRSYSAFRGIPIPLHTISRPSVSSNREGYSSLAISPCRLKLYAFCTDANIYAFNIGTYNNEPHAIYTTPARSSYFCKTNLSPDGKFISGGSVDGLGFIWSVDRPGERLVSLEGHGAEVTCIDWCKYGNLKLASCSDDGTYRIWKVSNDSDESASSGGFAKRDNIVSTTKYRKPYFASHILAPTRKRKRSISLESSPKKGISSPKKLCTTPKKIELALRELPNYVVDGVSPHQPLLKLSQTPIPGPDWLSKIAASTPPSKPVTSAKKNRRTPVQNGKSARGSLLKYFKPNDDSPSKPVEDSSGKPIEDSPSKPIEDPPSKPIEDSLSKPIEDSPSKPIGDPPSKPFEDPPSKPFEDPPSKPIGDSSSKPIEDSLSKPIEDSPSKPIGDPPNKPIGDSSCKPIEDH